MNEASKGRYSTLKTLFDPTTHLPLALREPNEWYMLINNENT